jgi:hypothetical protein
MWLPLQRSKRLLFAIEKAINGDRVALGGIPPAAGAQL